METRLMQVTVEKIAQMDRSVRGLPQYFARHEDGRVFVWPDTSGKLEELPVPVKLVQRTAEERAEYFENKWQEGLGEVVKARDKITELEKIQGDRRETVRVAFRRLGILGTGQILSEENMEEGLKALDRMDMAERLVEALRPIYESHSCTHPPGCDACPKCGSKVGFSIRKSGDALVVKCICGAPIKKPRRWLVEERPGATFNGFLHIGPGQTPNICIVLEVKPITREQIRQTLEKYNVTWGIADLFLRDLGIEVED